MPFMFRRASEFMWMNFKRALQALGAFGDAQRLSRPVRRAELVEQLLRTIARHEVGDHPGRMEPLKRRPKPHKLLKEPRRVA